MSAGRKMGLDEALLILGGWLEARPCQDFRWGSEMEAREQSLDVVSVLRGLQSIGLRRCFERVTIGLSVCFYGGVAVIGAIWLATMALFGFEFVTPIELFPCDDR